MGVDRYEKRLQIGITAKDIWDNLSRLRIIFLFQLKMFIP